MTQQSYIGNIITLPSKLTVVPKEGARYAVCIINWSDYVDDPNIDPTITVNVNANSGTNPLSQIAAIGVFNKSAIAPCTINFIDSGQSIYVAPLSSAFFPANTSLLSFNVEWNEPYTPSTSDYVVLHVFNFVPPTLSPSANIVSTIPAGRQLAILNSTYTSTQVVQIASWSDYATITTIKAKLYAQPSGSQPSIDNYYTALLNIPGPSGMENIAWVTVNNLSDGVIYEQVLCDMENVAIQAPHKIDFQIWEMSAGLQISTEIVVEYIL